MTFQKNKYWLFLLLLVLCVWVNGFSQTLRKNDVRAIRQTAEAFERVGQHQHAADYYIRAGLANPKDVSAYLGAKRVLDHLQDYDRFEEFIVALEQKRHDIRYNVDLGWVLFKKGKEAEAKKKWSGILQENPKNQQAFALVGQAYVEQQLYEKAIETYKAGRKALGQKTAFMFDLANMYKILDEPDKLVEEYLNYLEVHPQQITFLAAEIQRYAQNKDNIPALLKELNKALKKRSDVEWAVRLFLADLYTMTNNYAAGFIHVTELENQLLQLDAKKTFRSYQKGKYLYEFANSALNNNAPDVAEQAFLKIITDFSDSKYVTKSKLGLAQVYLNRGDYARAIEALQLFVDSNKKSIDSYRALMQIGDISFQQLFDIEKAEQAYKQALKEYTNIRFQIETLFRLADCAVARDDLPAAERRLNRVKSKAANESDLLGEALLKLAHLEFYRMRPKQSLHYLDEFDQALVSDDKPNVLENDALELAILIQENSHDSTGLAILGKARLLVFQRKYSEAKLEIESWLIKNPNTQLLSELRLQLVDVYRTLDEFEPAVTLLDSIYGDEESFFRDVALMTSAAIYEHDLTQPATAQQKYEQVLIEFPGSIYLEKARKKVRELE